MATKSNTKDLSNLVINKVASPEVYNSMVSAGQINEDELYLVGGDETVTYTLGQNGQTITLTGSDGSTSSVTADESGAASSAVSAHNSSATAHSDIRNAIPSKTSQLTNDSGFITTGDIPEGAAASTTLPIMDGTATTGTELAFARGDHIHPTDTSRAAAVHTHTASDITSGLATVATSGLYTDLSGKPSIPDSTSDLTNDSGFITSSDIPVTSVNSKMGAVSLTYSDVGAAASSHGTHVTFDSTNNPKMDGTAAKGTATTVARSDHVHPTDTSRASASDLSTHTGNTTIHITATERSNWNAKAETSDIPTALSELTNDAGFITTSDIPEGAAASTTTPAMDGTAAVGTELAFARGDHVHPTDTSRAPTSHASTATTYGKGTNSNYGHVKLSDATNGTSAAASGGVAATPKAVADALTSAKSYADGISANDFTDTLKSKLEGIESGAQVNTVTSVNSKTGAVSLSYSDVGAAASNHGTHVTYSTTNPVMDGTAAVGTASTVARSDHVHPTDTSRASSSDLTSHTSNTTVHITASERTAWNAKAEASDIPTKTSDLTNDSGFITTGDIPEGAAASTTSPKMDGTATVGTELAFARGDHIHPTDTSRAPTSHASTATTYGTGTASNYGHVKLSDSTSATTAAASGGTAATPKAVSDALTAAKSYADGISANDFTDTLKSKLEGIESGAQVNTVTSVNSKTGAVSLTYTDVGAAASSHGTHVTFDTVNNPVMDGTASKGSATTVARSDHVHPTDTSRASQSQVDDLVSDIEFVDSYIETIAETGIISIDGSDIMTHDTFKGRFAAYNDYLIYIIEYLNDKVTALETAYYNNTHIITK